MATGGHCIIMLLHHRFFANPVSDPIPTLKCHLWYFSWPLTNPVYVWEKTGPVIIDCVYMGSHCNIKILFALCCRPSYLSAWSSGASPEELVVTVSLTPWLSSRGGPPSSFFPKGSPRSQAISGLSTAVHRNKITGTTMHVIQTISKILFLQHTKGTNNYNDVDHVTYYATSALL